MDGVRTRRPEGEQATTPCSPMYSVIFSPLRGWYGTLCLYGVVRRHQPTVCAEARRRAPVARSSATVWPSAPCSTIVVGPVWGGSRVWRISPLLCPASNVHFVLPVAGSKPSIETRVAAVPTGGLLESIRPVNSPVARRRMPVVGSSCRLAGELTLGSD